MAACCQVCTWVQSRDQHSGGTALKVVSARHTRAFVACTHVRAMPGLLSPQTNAGRPPLMQKQKVPYVQRGQLGLFPRWRKWDPNQPKREAFKGQTIRLKATNFSLHSYLRSNKVQSQAVTMYFKEDTFEWDKTGPGFAGLWGHRVC